MNVIPPRTPSDRLLGACSTIAIGFALLLAVGPISATTEVMTEEQARQRIHDELKVFRGADKRALALARLAWPEEPLPHRLSSMARQNLVEFGDEALIALRHAAPRVRPVYQADATTALLEAKARIPTGMPTMYLPALEDIIWFATPDAKRIAIPEITRYKYPQALMTIIDAAYEYPELRETVIDSLAKYGNRRARYFLDEVLSTGTPAERFQAAEALIRIGDPATDIVRKAILSDDRETREASVAAWLPLSSVDDISRLYEYIAGFPQDDAQLIRRVTRRAEQMEQVLEAQFTRDSSSD